MAERVATAVDAEKLKLEQGISARVNQEVLTKLVEEMRKQDATFQRRVATAAGLEKGKLEKSFSSRVATAAEDQFRSVKATLQAEILQKSDELWVAKKLELREGLEKVIQEDVERLYEAERQRLIGSFDQQVEQKVQHDLLDQSAIQYKDYQSDVRKIVRSKVVAAVKRLDEKFQTLVDALDARDAQWLSTNGALAWNRVQRHRAAGFEVPGKEPAVLPGHGPRAEAEAASAWFRAKREREGRMERGNEDEDGERERDGRGG